MSVKASLRILFRSSRRLARSSPMARLNCLAYLFSLVDVTLLQDIVGCVEGVEALATFSGLSSFRSLLPLVRILALLSITVYDCPSLLTDCMMTFSVHLFVV